MKSLLKILSVFFISIAIGCGESEQKEEIRLSENEPVSTSEAESEPQTDIAEADPLKNKGIGPINNIDLPAEVDAQLSARGEELFKNLCSACHKMEKKFVGPALAGVTERRSHEWIMNMILNPEEMIKKDPIAKQLLIESNMAMMADQNLTEDEARAILEYFRQYDQN